MNNPIFSIIIPVFNSSIFLQQCLESIKNQSFYDFEAILVDDGSTDDSGKICDLFSKDDNRFVTVHKSNSGVSAARNSGIELAKGQFITFVDSDDWVDNDYLESIYKEMKDTDLLFWGFKAYINDNYKFDITYDDFSCQDRMELEDRMFQLMTQNKRHPLWGYTWNKCFRHEIIKKNNIRFDEKLSIKEDELFTCDYAICIERIKNLKVSMYNYRIQQAGLTSKKNTSEEYLELAHKINNCIQSYKNYNLIEFEKKRVYKYLKHSYNAQNNKALKKTIFKEICHFVQSNKPSFDKKIIILTYLPFCCYDYLSNLKN